MSAAAVASGREVRSLWARDCRGGGLCRAWYARARARTSPRPACTTYSRRLRRRRERERLRQRDVSKCPNASSSSLVRHSVLPSVSRAGLPVRFTQQIGRSYGRTLIRSFRHSNSDFNALRGRKDARRQSERVSECSAGKSVSQLRAMLGEFWSHIA